MGLIVAEKFIYPTEIPGFVRWNKKKDPVLATDHWALWKLLLAIEKTVGLNPVGRFSTMESRVMNGFRLNGRVVSANNTGVSPSWEQGVTINWSDGIDGSLPSPLFLEPPAVLINVRQGVASGDGATPFKFWTVPTGDPAVDRSQTTVKGRSKNGGALGAGTTSVSLVAIGLAEPFE